MIVFTDYRLIGDFVEKCRKDIEGKDCGRVSMKTHSDTQVFYHHSQVNQKNKTKSLLKKRFLFALSQISKRDFFPKLGNSIGMS